MLARSLTIVLLGFSLVACNATNPIGPVSLTSIEQQVEDLTNSPKVTYKLPQEQSTEIGFNSFKMRCLPKICDQYEALKYSREEQGINVEYRLYGSLRNKSAGVVYTVSETIETQDDIKAVTLQPVKKLSEREKKLVIDVEAPEFDIVKYLSEASFDTNFEFNSDFQPTSVKANFDRLLKRADVRFVDNFNTVSNLDLEEHYTVTLDGADVLVRVEVFPYRNGSKAVVYALLQTNSTANTAGVIDVSAMMSTLKGKIKDIVNS